MKRINDLQVTDISFNPRSVQITWASEKNDLIAQSCLYQHSDGSWAVDPTTRSLGAEVGEQLLRQLMKHFLEQAFPYNDSSHMSNSEIDRVEGILKREEMYQKSLIKPKASEKKSKPVIRVWRAD
jgi:hypothetical protein